MPIQGKPDIGIYRVGHAGLQNPDNRDRRVSGVAEALTDECRVTAHTLPETVGLTTATSSVPSTSSSGARRRP